MRLAKNRIAQGPLTGRRHVAAHSDNLQLVSGQTVVGLLRVLSHVQYTLTNATLYRLVPLPTLVGSNKIFPASHLHKHPLF